MIKETFENIFYEAYNVACEELYFIVMHQNLCKNKIESIKYYN